MSTRTVAAAIKKRLDEGFRWTSDSDTHAMLEHWQSMADAVRAEREWRDDCDGYALTAAQLAVEDVGLPERAVAIVECRTETGGAHLVCFVSGKETWVIDNRMSAVWRPNEMRGYRWVRGLTIGEKEWRTPK